MIESHWLQFPKADQIGTGTELLPPDWNTDHDVYQLCYTRKGKAYLVKGVTVDGQLLLTIAVCAAHLLIFLSWL